MDGDRGGRPAPANDPRFRLFLAVEVPSEVKDLAVAATRELRERFPRARWVPAANLHVTLAFLGAVDPGMVRWVEERAYSATVSLAPFEVALRRLGAFPRTSGVRVLWAGFDDPTGGLPALARALADELDERFPSPERPFTAHMTLARADPPIAVDRERLAAMEPRSEPFPVEGVRLLRSYLGGPAPRYEPVASFPLRGGAADPPAAR